MMIRFRHALTFLIGAVSTMHCLGADLLSVYQLAEENDPVYLGEAAAYRAVLESRPQALSGLLPDVSLRINTDRREQDISSARQFGDTGEFSFNNRGYTLNVSQPLFRYDRFIALQQSDTEINQAEAELARAKQDLIVRTAERYFQVLADRDNLKFARAEVKALSRQLEQAQQRLDVGLGTITDVQEAQAGYDLAVAQEIRALNAIGNAREAVRELTGDYIDLFSVLGEQMPLISPEPAIIDNWTQLSLEQNLNVIAVNYAAETAQKAIKRQRAGHYPTLDLTAFRSYNSSGGRFGVTKIHGTSVGLELNIPIYSGGAISSRTRQAYENYNAAIYALEQTRRSAQRLTREAYRGVISGISQVKALNQAVVSSETALKATESGFAVGTRTTVDVVASQRTTSAAKRDYSRARYDYLLNTLRLKLSAGTLSPDDLAIINNWLTEK